MISTPLALTTLIALATWLAFWMDRHVAWAGKMGASLLALAFGAILTNTGVVPAASPVYDTISGPVTSLAIAWLLLSVDLRDLKSAGRPMLIAFGLAAAGTALGALIGALVFSGAFGDDTWRLAGTLTGTYTGGSVNFVSVGRAVALPDSLFAGANAADALTTGIWLAVTLTASVWLARILGIPGRQASPPPEVDLGAETPKDAAAERAALHPFFARVRFSTLDAGALLAVGLLLLWVAQWLGGVIPGVPSILWLTTLALVVGHATPMGRTPGAMQLGNLALHLFFVIIGIYSRIADIAAVGVEVFLFTLLVVGVHGVVVYGGGRLARIDVGTLSVASQAAVGGPSSALAVAVSREWRGLILPGVVVGLLGYAVGNYLGLGVAALARGLL